MFANNLVFKYLISNLFYFYYPCTLNLFAFWFSFLIGGKRRKVIDGELRSMCKTENVPKNVYKILLHVCYSKGKKRHLRIAVIDCQVTAYFFKKIKQSSKNRNNLKTLCLFRLVSNMWLRELTVYPLCYIHCMVS